MLTASVVLFMYVALTGLVMAVGIFKGAKLWMPLALGHGALAATALVLALLASLATGVAAIEYGVAVLLLAALGGLLHFSHPLRGSPHPWAGLRLHALLASGGGGCLVFALLQ